MSDTPQDFFHQASVQSGSPWEGSVPPEKIRQESRRALFRAGLSVAPLILTLPSRSAWGQSGGNGTQVTPISAAKKAGLSEEQIEQLRQQLQQAQGTFGSGWQQDDLGDSPEP